MSDRGDCQHLERQDAESYALNGKRLRDSETVLLCGWADANPKRLLDMPPWIQREALAGYLIRAGDCETCPARANPDKGREG